MRIAIRKISIALFLILMVPMLNACGEGAATGPATPGVIATPPATVTAAATPLVESTPLPVASPDVFPATAEPFGFEPTVLTSEELLEYKPNELGGIPIFMYHNIVTDPSLEGHLYRTADEFYNDLQWLYDNNFYLVGMNSVVRGQFNVPAGKHAVVLTFDDSSSMHLSFEMGPDGQPLRDENGDFVISPNSAVGIIERFAAEHPDFGKAAHFSTIPVFKFSWPEYEQDEWYETKVQWLLENNYEIGNHTSDHTDMTLMDSETFARNIAEPYIWISEMVDKNDPNFAMGVLTLPYGAYEEGGWTGDKFEYLANGFTWEGQEIPVEGVMLVCCGANQSPFHDDYRRLWIARIRGDDPDYQRLKEEIENGWVILYTSDGNPDTVTVPWPLPESQWGKLNEDAITNRGLTLVKYHPETGRMYAAIGPRDQHAYNCVERARVSA